MIYCRNLSRVRGDASLPQSGLILIFFHYPYKTESKVNEVKIFYVKNKKNSIEIVSVQ